MPEGCLTYVLPSKKRKGCSFLITLCSSCVTVDQRGRVHSPPDRRLSGLPRGKADGRQSHRIGPAPCLPKSSTPAASSTINIIRTSTSQYHCHHHPHPQDHCSHHIDPFCSSYTSSSASPPPPHSSGFSSSTRLTFISFILIIIFILISSSSSCSFASSPFSESLMMSPQLSVLRMMSRTLLPAFKTYNYFFDSMSTTKQVLFLGILFQNSSSGIYALALRRIEHLCILHNECPTRLQLCATCLHTNSTMSCDVS